LFLIDPELGGLNVGAAIVSQGLDVGPITGAVGIFVGTPLRADRASGRVMASSDELAAWATEQAQIWRDSINMHWRDSPESTDMLCGLGADISGIHICCSRDAYLDAEQLTKWAEDRNEIFVLQGEDIDVIETRDGLDIWDKEEHVVVDIGENTLVSFDPRDRYRPASFFGDGDDYLSSAENSDGNEDSGARQWWLDYKYPSIDKVMVLAIAKAWGLSTEKVLDDCLQVYDNFMTVERPMVEIDEQSVLYLSWSIKRSGQFASRSKTGS
jgi:hypothetical protein